MADLEAKFQKAAEEVKSFDAVSQDGQLKLYGFFKQANSGDCDTDRPGMFDPKGRAKWDAWKANEGMSKEDAMTKYVELVDSLRN